MIDFLLRIIAATALGGLIGSERERALRQRIVGLRTFALLALFGALVGAAQLFRLPFEALFITSLLGVFIFVYYLHVALKIGIRVGLSTLVAIPLTFLFGVIIGIGRIIEGIALGFIILTVFVVGRILHKFVERLTEKEITNIVELGLILFVLFPIVPEQIIIADFVIDVRLFFYLLFFILFLNLLLYLLNSFLKLPLTNSGFINGMISSTMTIYILAQESKRRKDFAIPAIAAMLGSVAKNIFLIVILFPAVVKNALPIFLPLLLILVAPILFFKGKEMTRRISLEIPFSIKNGIKFAIVLFAFILLLRYFSGMKELIPLTSFGIGLVSSTEAILSLLFVSEVLSLTTIVSSLAAIIFASTITSICAALFGSRDFIKATVPTLTLAAIVVVVASFYFGIV